NECPLVRRKIARILTYILHGLVNGLVMDITAMKNAFEEFSKNAPPQGAISNGRTENDFQLPIELSYEIDAWGRVRKNVESHREAAQACESDYHRQHSADDGKPEF